MGCLSDSGFGAEIESVIGSCREEGFQLLHCSKVLHISARVSEINPHKDGQGEPPNDILNAIRRMLL
jgi:hypothetical protein